MAAKRCILIFSLLCVKQSICQYNTIEHSRIKRVPLLIFPPTSPTRVQLIFGIGIPQENLDFQSLTNGWVLKYEYFLPSNATQLYVPATLKIAGRSIEDDKNRNEKYQAEAVQIDTGFDGSDPDSGSLSNELDEFDTEFDELSEIREKKHKTLSKYRWAVYKALEAAADRKGFVGRSCVLKSICETAGTPFHYQNGLFAELMHIILTPSASVDEISAHSDNEYFQAEFLGKSGAPCNTVFKDCERSLMDIFTNILDVSDDLLHIFK